MIKNRLAILLAERQLKITKVAKDTGISRNTITSTVQNDGSMIKLDTIETLCNYLNVEPKDFFDYSPYNFFIKGCQMSFEKNEMEFNLVATLKNKVNSKTVYHSKLEYFINESKVENLFELSQNEFENLFNNSDILKKTIKIVATFKIKNGIFDNGVKELSPLLLNELLGYISDSIGDKITNFVYSDLKFPSPFDSFVNINTNFDNLFIEEKKNSFTTEVTFIKSK